MKNNFYKGCVFVPAKRRDVREAAFLLSFETIFTDDSIDNIFELAREVDNFPFDEETENLVKGIYEKRNELDEIISKFSTKRALSRIPKIDLAVLRLAIYEALYDEKVPLNVAISEGVSLTQRYANDTDVAFVNGILGAFSKSQEAE